MTPRLTCFPMATLLFSSFRMFPPLKIGAVYANGPPTVNPVFVLTWRRTYTLRKQWVLHYFQPRRGSLHIIKSIFFANRDQKSSILNQIIAPPESLQTIVFQGWTSLQESHLHLWLLTSDFISGSGALLRSHLSED